MLALPFVSAIILARDFRWEVIPAAAAVVGVFLLREPLVVIARQRFVWKQPHAEIPDARRSAVWYFAALAVTGALLLWRLPRAPMLIMAAGAAGLTALAVWQSVRNRQRSIPFQLLSAAGLTASALIGWLSVRADVQPAILWLWILQFAHSAGSVMTVHARIEARYGHGATKVRSQALMVQGVLLAVAVGCLRIGTPWPALALALSGGAHFADLLRMSSATLREIGMRELSLSIVFSALVTYGLM